jgi:hypothetical protein
MYAGQDVGVFGLREAEWIQHLAIFGRSGSGKTNLGFVILGQLLTHGKPVWVFDWKRNYRDAAQKLKLKVVTVGRGPRPFCFNPLQPPPGTDTTVWFSKLTDVMAHVYGIRQAATYVLQRALRDASQPGRDLTFAAVRDAVGQMRGVSREGQWLQSARRVIGALCDGPIGRVYLGPPASLEDLLSQSVVFELDALTDADKTFFVDTLLLWLQHYRLQDGRREDFKHAVLVEEAHHVVLRRRQSREGVMDVVLREIRELGESVILIDQHPSLVSIPSLGNTYCTIVMNLKHGNDVSAIGAALRLDTQAREYLGRLPVGWAMVRLQDRWPHPFLIAVPKYDVRKGSVTDDQLPPTGGDSAVVPDIRPPEGIVTTIRPVRQNHGPRDLSDRYGDVDDLRLLTDVCVHPLCGVAERYRRLGWSADRGTRAKATMVKQGALRPVRIRLASGSILALVPSRRGLARLGRVPPWPDIDDHASAEHEFWKGWLFVELRRRGLDVRAETALANGHRVDLLVGRGTTTVAVEIETGKSDVARNVGATLAAGIPLMLVATSREALAASEATVDAEYVLAVTAAELVGRIDAIMVRLGLAPAETSGNAAA